MRQIFIIIICFLCLGCTKQEPVETLTYATWGSQSEMKIIKPIIAKFEETRGVKVNLIHAPQNYFQKLHLLFAAKQAPDVLFINNYYLKLYVNAGLLENLTPYFQEELKKHTFFENSIKAMSLGTSLYAVPRDISNVVVYYNKSLLKSLNIEFPTQNWDYNTFEQLAQKLKIKGYYAIGFEENPIFWEPILWSNGGEIFGTNDEILINKKESLEALKFYTELRTVKNYAPTRLQSANRTMAQLFLDQKIAMQISGRWLVPKYRAEAHFDWDVVPLPQGKYGSIAGSDTSGWAISKTTKNKELAIDFVKHIASQNSIKQITKSGLITPARMDCAYSEYFLDGQKPKNAKIFLEINKNAKITNIPQNYNQKIEKLMKKLEPYFTDKEKISPTTKFEL